MTGSSTGAVKSKARGQPYVTGEGAMHAHNKGSKM